MHEFVLSRADAEARARRHRARRREAADGLRVPSADDLLPARRPRGADDRADGDRGEGDARRVLPTRCCDRAGGGRRPGARFGRRRTDSQCAGSTRCGPRSSPSCATGSRSTRRRKARARASSRRRRAPDLLHLRIVVPDDRRAEVLDLLDRDDAVLNIAVFERAARKPEGHLVFCDVAREDASVTLSRPRSSDIAGAGSIALEEVETPDLAGCAERAERAAPGSPLDAVVWEEVESRTSERSSCPARTCVHRARDADRGGRRPDGLADPGHRRDGRRPRVRADRRLLRGLRAAPPRPGGAIVRRARGRASRSRSRRSFLHAWFLRSTGIPPASYRSPSQPSNFISSPNFFSFFVAAVAGVAGMLSLRRRSRARSSGC